MQVLNDNELSFQSKLSKTVERSCEDCGEWCYPLQSLTVRFFQMRSRHCWTWNVRPDVANVPGNENFLSCFFASATIGDTSWSKINCNNKYNKCKKRNKTVRGRCVKLPCSLGVCCLRHLILYLRRVFSFCVLASMKLISLLSQRREGIQLERTRVVLERLSKRGYRRGPRVREDGVLVWQVIRWAKRKMRIWRRKLDTVLPVNKGWREKIIEENSRRRWSFATFTK